MDARTGRIRDAFPTTTWPPILWPEQHCLGLVVKGVAKQHGATTGMLQQGGSPGSTGSSLRAVRITGVDVHLHDDGWHVVTGKLGASLLGDLV